MDDSNERQSWPRRLLNKINPIAYVKKDIASVTKDFKKQIKKMLMILIFVLGVTIALLSCVKLEGNALFAGLALACVIIGVVCIKRIGNWWVENRTKVREAGESEAEKKRLREENVKLRRRLDEQPARVLGVREILQVSFIEAECEITKVFDRYFDKDRKEIHEDDEESSPDTAAAKPKKAWRFVGALTAKFKAKYGIQDVHKISVFPDDSSRTLRVHGAEPTYLGPGDFPEMRWEGCVALRQSILGTWSVDEGPLGPNWKEQYREEMQTALKNGPEQLSWLKEPLRRNIIRLLEMVIAPKDYRVELVERKNPDFLPLEEYRRGEGERFLLE